MSVRKIVGHSLKIWPQYFDAVKDGRKTFEVRKSDRDFREGDLLELREYDPVLGYTGRKLSCGIGYVLYNFEGLAPGYCVMSLKYVAEG